MTKLNDNQSALTPTPVKITAYETETPDSFTITLDLQMEHLPGQFVNIGVPGIGESPISICSYSKDYVKLNIRQVGNVTKHIAKLKKGDTVYVRGPYGKGYPMEKFKGDSLIFIGGGCGVAPLRGAIDYAEKNKQLYGDIYLYLGFRSPNDIMFKKELAGWEKNYKLHVAVDTVPSNTCYDGKVGFVTELLKATEMDEHKKVVMICGPPIMMEKVIAILKEKGFKDDQIFVSAERLMYCAVGKCGHCMIRGKYTCKDGPVFRWDEIGGEHDG